MRYSKLFILLFFLSVITSCFTHSSVVLLNPMKKYSPTTIVEILLEKPTKPYVEIALIHGEGREGVPITQILETMRKKAMEIGADAIIPIGEKEITTKPDLIVPTLGGGFVIGSSGGYTFVKAIAIKYSDQSK